MEMLPALRDDGPLPRSPAQVCVADRLLPVHTEQVVGVIAQSASFSAESRDIDEIAFYAVKAARMRELGTSILWLGSFGSLLHARRAVLGARKSGLPLFLCMEPAPGEELLSAGGDSLLSSLVILQELGIAAFGLSGPFECIEPLLKRLASYSRVPFLAMPHIDREPHIWSACVRWLLEAGVRVIGVEDAEEACRQELPSLYAQYEHQTPKCAPRPKDAPLILADSGTLHFLEEDFTLTAPLRCELDMTAAVVEAETEAHDALLIEIASMEDAEHFALNLPLFRDPICLLAHHANALEYALRACIGRLLVDARSEIEADTLRRIAADYGAIIR